MEYKLTTDQIARWFIGFIWIYHGIATKLITIAPIEYYLSSQFGFGEQGTFWFIKLCGVGELTFGIVFLIFYRSRVMVYANIFAMASLMVMVVFLDYRYLVEGFNPVTTNIPVIGLSLILLNELEKAKTVVD